MVTQRIETFTKFVDNWLHEWTGWSIESIFEVNAIVINPELVFFSNYNKGVFDYCESIGNNSSYHSI